MVYYSVLQMPCSALLSDYGVVMLYVFLFFVSFTDLNSREQETCQSVHVINVDIQDNHEEATLGAFLICELCQCVSLYILIWCIVAHFIKCRNGMYTWLPSFVSQATLKF